MPSSPKRNRLYYNEQRAEGIRGGMFDANCPTVKISAYETKQIESGTPTEEFVVRWVGPKGGEIAKLSGDRHQLANHFRNLVMILENVP